MTLTIGFSKEQAELLAAKAQAQGVTAEEYVRQVLQQEIESARPQARVWEKIAESRKRVPPEDFAAMPKDGASQIDHYLYGAPKRAL